MKTVTGPWGTFRTYDDLVGTTIGSGFFWDEQIRGFLDSADPSGWALDLGAHVGWFTVYLAQRHRYVIAVEAHPGTFSLLQANVRAHGLKNVMCLRQAAYHEHATLHLASDDQLGWAVPDEGDLNSCASPASIGFVPYGHRLAVPAGPVDALLLSSTPVSLIKIDVQGCDLRALHGLERTITRWRPKIAFEFEQAASAWHGDTWEDYLAFFAKHRYTVARVREDLWDYTATPEVL